VPKKKKVAKKDDTLDDLLSAGLSSKGKKKWGWKWHEIVSVCAIGHWKKLYVDESKGHSAAWHLCVSKRVIAALYGMTLARGTRLRRFQNEVPSNDCHVLINIIESPQGISLDTKGPFYCSGQLVLVLWSPCFFRERIIVCSRVKAQIWSTEVRKKFIHVALDVNGKTFVHGHLLTQSQRGRRSSRRVPGYSTTQSHAVTLLTNQTEPLITSSQSSIEEEQRMARQRRLPSPLYSRPWQEEINENTIEPELKQNKLKKLKS
jgi:hypothetical protein